MTSQLSLFALELGNKASWEVIPIPGTVALDYAVKYHYLHRRAHVKYSYGLTVGNVIQGIITFGYPASRHVQVSACSRNPGIVLELNRLWVADELPRNSETWFIARALALLPPRIIISYADTSYGHFGKVYQACNFHYAGWSCMERKTPKRDRLVSEKHYRHAKGGIETPMVTRSTKIKYWTVTGNRSDRRRLERLCDWPSLSWHEYPPPSEHYHLNPALISS